MSSGATQSSREVTSTSRIGTGSPLVATGPMTRRKYLTYLYFFNHNDPRFADFYDKDVVFRTEPFGTVRGRKAIARRFGILHRQLQETIVPTEIAIDSRHHLMAVELINHIRALQDNVKLPSHTLNKGDELILRGVIIYGLANGRIDLIRGPIEGDTLIPAPGR